VRDDVYSIASQITRGLLSRQEAIADWRGRNEQAISRLNQLLATITAQAPDLAPVSVALRIASSGVSSADVKKAILRDGLFAEHIWIQAEIYSSTSR
jgi:hypothetical protein